MTTETVTLGAALPIPMYPPSMSNAPTDAGMQVNASGEYVAFICQIPKSGNLVGATYIVHSRASTSDTDLRLETVSTSGSSGAAPSGTLYHANAEETGATVPATNNIHTATWTSFAVTKGDMVAFKIAYPASGSADFQVRRHARAIDYGNAYIYHDDGSPAVQNGSPMMWFNYDDGSVAVPIGCFGAQEALTQNVNTSGVRVAGNVFELPFGGVVTGAWFVLDPGYSFDVYIVEEDADFTGGTPDAYNAHVSYQRGAYGTGNDGMFFVDFGEEVTLVANTKYRLVILAEFTTAIQFGYLEYPSAALQDADLFSSNSFVYGTEYSGLPTQDSDWTDLDVTNFETYMCGLFFKKITVTVV